MKVVNLPTVAVDTTAGGTEIFSAAAARIAASEGLMAVLINPSVDIALVDPDGTILSTQIPGAVAGTYANSAATCPAGVATTVLHRSGPLRAISSSGTATVKVTPVEGP